MGELMGIGTVDRPRNLVKLLIELGFLGITCGFLLGALTVPAP